MMLKMEQWNGVQLSPERVNDMIRQAVTWLQDDPTETVAYVLSGDTMILATRYPKDGNMVELHVCTVRQHGYEYDPTADPDIFHV